MLIGDQILNRHDYAPTSRRVASRRVARALPYIAYAAQQLFRASQAAPDRFNRDRLHVLADGLRRLTLPLSRIASRLEKGGAK